MELDRRYVILFENGKTMVLRGHEINILAKLEKRWKTIKLINKKSLTLLEESDIEYDEWNDLMLTLDSGYMEILFNSDGNILDIRARVSE